MTDKPIVIENGQLKRLPASTVMQLAACVAGAASLNMPHGTAPTSPVDGDVWTTSAGIFVQINGSTIGPLAASGGGGGTSKVWDFMWGALNSASAGAFAFKGLRVIPRQTIVVDGLATDLVTPVNGATYVAYIVSMTSTTVINTVLGTSSTFTASGTSRINPLLLTFASGVTLTSGSAYSIIIGCTSSTGTTALPVPSTSTALRYTNAPLQNDGFVTLTTAPVNGATLTYGSTPDGYLTGVRWQTN